MIDVDLADFGALDELDSLEKVKDMHLLEG